MSGPVLKNIDNLSLVPLVIGDNETAVLSCDITADCLSFYGMTSLTKGYPLGCKYGEEVAEVTVTFNDNSVQKTIFKNGVDITTAFCLNNSSRINPVAEKSKKLACFGYDKNFEQYVINEYVLKFSDLKYIKQITVASKNNGYEMLLYGIGY